MRELKNNYPLFSERLTLAMKMNNLKIVDLARKMNLTKGIVSNYKHGYFKPKDERMVELADALGVAPEWLDGYDVPMDKKREESNITPVIGSMRLINIYSYISCGNGEFNDGIIVDTISLPVEMFKNNREYFGVYAKGDSMKDAGIFDGDRVIIDRAVEPRDGSIVIAWWDGGFTMKYLDLTHRKDGYIELRPANPDYPVFRIDNPDEFRVWGTVIHLIRTFERL